MARLWLIGGLVLTLSSGLSAAQLESTTYRLEQSDAAHAIWTSPPSERVFKDDALPPLVGSEIRVYAAQNEFEPFQVVLKPSASGNITVRLGSFGSEVTTEPYQVKYVSLEQASDNLGRLGDYPDPLWPIESGDSVAVTAGENTAFWITVGVAASAG